MRKINTKAFLEKSCTILSFQCSFDAINIVYGKRINVFRFFFQNLTPVFEIFHQLIAIGSSLLIVILVIAEERK